VLIHDSPEGVLHVETHGLRVLPDGVDIEDVRHSVNCRMPGIEEFVTKPVTAIGNPGTHPLDVNVRIVGKRDFGLLAEVIVAVLAHDPRGEDDVLDVPQHGGIDVTFVGPHLGKRSVAPDAERTELSFGFGRSFHLIHPHFVVRTHDQGRVVTVAVSRRHINKLARLSSSNASSSVRTRNWS
jgi:hypothetical protein